MERLKKLGQVEVAMLRYVAEKGPVTVGQAAEHFAATHGHARSTVMTMMERLRRKGLLRRHRWMRIFHYQPAVPADVLDRALVEDFVDHTLGGSMAPLVAYLGEHAPVSDAERVAIAALIAKLRADDSDP